LPKVAAEAKSSSARRRKVAGTLRCAVAFDLR
jgi:hypothetical protein